METRRSMDEPLPDCTPFSASAKALPLTPAKEVTRPVQFEKSSVAVPVFEGSGLAKGAPVSKFQEAESGLPAGVGVGVAGGGGGGVGVAVGTGVGVGVAV